MIWQYNTLEDVGTRHIFKGIELTPSSMITSGFFDCPGSNGTAWWVNYFFFFNSFSYATVYPEPQPVLATLLAKRLISNILDVECSAISVIYYYYFYSFFSFDDKGFSRVDYTCNFWDQYFSTTIDHVSEKLCEKNVYFEKLD